ADAGRRARAEGDARLRAPQARRCAAPRLVLEDRAMARDGLCWRGGNLCLRLPAHRPRAGTDARAAGGDDALRRGDGVVFDLHPALYVSELLAAAVKEVLPIDAALPEVLEALERRSIVVLEAPPGAGKTTRVPPALLDRVQGEVVVLEPRRLAARMAARRVAL